MLRLTLSSAARAVRSPCVCRTSTVRHLSARMVKGAPRRTDIPKQVQDAVDALPRLKEVDGPGPVEYTAPVTSAHMINGKTVSTLDSAAIAPDGTVVHGRYGVIPEPAASAIPLEYLALLRPAAEGAAALRVLNPKQPGTLLIYGASKANGMALSHMADAAGHTIIAVVSSDHASNQDLMFAVKNSLKEPSVAVPDDLAFNKAEFRDLVKGISTGDEGYPDMDPEAFTKDFKELLIKYTEAFPDTRPAAVAEDAMEFKYMEKDREMWEMNQGTYLEENFPPGAPPIDQAKLDKFFTPQQYEIFRRKFWKQTIEIASGLEGDLDFSPPHLVQELTNSPEDPQQATQFAGGDPYTFSIFNKNFFPNTHVPAGGPIIGAVLCVTPELERACKAVAAGKTLRDKAEALKFLNKTDRLTLLAANSVARQATDAGKPVYVIGGELPGLDTVKPTDADVEAAIQAMDIDEKGNTVINFFIQSYRANDFPFYADYAVYRANEALAGPRQIIVLK